jgi:hypothetical protein
MTSAMPHFAVDVNNVRVTTINLASMRVMDVSVHGALDRALKAAADAMGDAGKTFEQLFPDETPSTQTDFSISDTMAAEIRTRPRLHAAFEVQASTPDGQQATAASDERNTGFRFSVLWNHFQPDQARVHLATCCLDDVLARMAGTTHLQTTIQAGESATLSLVA